MKTLRGKMKRSPVAAGALILFAAALLRGPAAAEDKKESPLVTAAKSLKLGGYAQFMAAEWDKVEKDTFSLRRARLSLSGGILKNLKFKIQMELVKSPVLLDAQIEFEPLKAVGLRFGQFLIPFSLESVTSTGDLDMINRTKVVDSLAAGRDNGASGRDVGAVLYGRWSILEYTAGLVNGAGINMSDTNNHKDFSGRVVLRPLKFLAIGGSLYRGKQTLTADSPLVARDKEGLEAALSFKGVTVKSEYIHAEDDLVSKAGWYVQGGCLVLKGKLQPMLRYESLDLDRSIAGNGKRVLTAGLNWFILGKTKLQVNYEIHTLEGGARQKSGLLAQFQAAF